MERILCKVSWLAPSLHRVRGAGGSAARRVGAAYRELRSSYTMRTKCAISDAFVRDCVFAYCGSVAQYVSSLSAEHCFRLRNNAISDERVRDCALSTHSVFRPLRSSYTMRAKCAISDAFVRACVFAYCASVAQYVYSLSAEHCFRLRNNAISDERVRNCALYYA